MQFNRKAASEWACIVSGVIALVLAVSPYLGISATERQGIMVPSACDCSRSRMFDLVLFGNAAAQT